MRKCTFESSAKPIFLNYKKKQMVEIKIKINDERDQRTILKTEIPDSGFLDLSPGQKSKSAQSIVVVFNKEIVNKPQGG